MHKLKFKGTSKFHHLRRIKRSSRGLSPIIAEILLIGLTMLAGAVTFGTVIVVLNAKEPILVSIDSFSDFKLVNSTSSTRYNSFSFVLDNGGKRAVGFLHTDFELYNNTGGTKNPLSNWSIARDYELSALQSYYITISSNSTQPEDWLSFNSSITLQITVYGLDQSYSKADKSTISNSVTIGSSYVSSGPLVLKNNQTTNNFAELNATVSTYNSIKIDVENYGNIAVKYTLDFIVSNRSLLITTHYINSPTNLTSTIDGSLPSASGSNPATSANLNLNSTIVLTVSSSLGTAPSTEFYVIIWLKIESTIQDTLVIVCS